MKSATSASNLNRKLPRLKLLKLSLTRLLKNSNVFIKNVINFTCNGKTPLKIPASVMNLSTKLVRISVKRRMS